MNNIETAVTDYGYYESGEELTETYTPIEIYSDVTGEPILTSSEYVETFETTAQNTVEKNISDIKDGVQGIFTFLFLAFMFLIIYFFYRVLRWFL